MIFLFLIATVNALQADFMLMPNSLGSTSTLSFQLKVDESIGKLGVIQVQVPSDVS
jgi:hypothetical protein